MVWRISFDKNIKASPLVILESHLNTEENTYIIYNRFTIPVCHSKCLLGKVIFRIMIEMHKGN